MEWYINRGSKNCFHCERLFKEEEEYCSALYDVDNAFTRKDFCMECWNEKAGEGVFSYWKTKIQKKSETVQKYADTNVFYDLFIKLENEDDHSRVNFRYVLSLYLMRKKILKLKTTYKANGNEYLVFKNLKEDKDTKVFIPKLSKDEVLAVTEEIGKLVNCTPKI